jgi:transcription initiation factor TFIID TATA-box-binding protein
MVASFRVSQSLDLQKLSVILPESTYNPDEAPAVIMQCRKPRSVVTLFSDGTVTLTGPKSMADVEAVVRMIRDRLMVIGVELEENPAVTVSNTTVSADVGRTLDLKALAKILESTEYNPKKFPGLIYQTEHPKTVILLFDSGKIVCNGGTLKEIQQPLETLMKKLMMEGT